MALYLSGCPGLIATVIDWENLNQWGSLFTSNHKLRHRLFIEKRKWSAPKSINNMEADQYDDPAAKYIIVTNDGKTALASARLRPTTQPYMIKDIFPHFYPGPCPEDPTIWEATRFAAAGKESGISPQTAKTATKLLLSTMIEFGQKQNINHYIAIMPPAAYRIIRGLGQTIEEISQPILIDKQKNQIAKMTIPDTDIANFEQELGTKAQKINSHKTA